MAGMTNLVLPVALVAPMLVVAATGGLAFITWIVKQLMRHAEIMVKLETELVNTNSLAVSTAGQLASLVAATAAELARKVDAQAETIESQRKLDAAILAQTVKDTAAKLADTNK